MIYREHPYNSSKKIKVSRIKIMLYRLKMFFECKGWKVLLAISSLIIIIGLVIIVSYASDIERKVEFKEIMQTKKAAKKFTKKLGGKDVSCFFFTEGWGIDHAECTIFYGQQKTSRIKCFPSSRSVYGCLSE